MTRWNIDPAHSEVSFKVKHLLVSTVTGHFRKFDATIETSDDDFSDAKIVFDAEAATIDTKNEQRDAHLRSPDFFDAGTHPALSFVSTSVRKVSDHELKVTGFLTIRGLTKAIVLDVTYNGTVAGFGGTRVAGFEIRASVNRFDFGLKWNALTETGGVVVSNDVKIEILAEFNSAVTSAKVA